MNFCLPPFGATSSTPILLGAVDLGIAERQGVEGIGGQQSCITSKESKQKLAQLERAQSDLDFQRHYDQMFEFEHFSRTLIVSEWWNEAQIISVAFFSERSMADVQSEKPPARPLNVSAPPAKRRQLPPEPSQVPSRAAELFESDELRKRRQNFEQGRRQLHQLIDERNTEQDRIFDHACIAVKALLVPSRPPAETSPGRSKPRAWRRQRCDSCLPGIVLTWEFILSERKQRSDVLIQEHAERLTGMFDHVVAVDCVMPYCTLLNTLKPLHHWATDHRLSQLVLLQRWWRWSLDGHSRGRFLVAVREDCEVSRRALPPSQRWPDQYKGISTQSYQLSPAERCVRLESAFAICRENTFRQFIGALGYKIDSFIRENHSNIGRSLHWDTIAAETKQRRSLTKEEHVGVHLIVTLHRKMSLALNGFPEPACTISDAATEIMWPEFDLPGELTTAGEWKMLRGCEEASKTQRVRDLTFDRYRRRRDFETILSRFSLKGFRLSIFFLRLDEHFQRESLEKFHSFSFTKLIAFIRLFFRGGSAWQSFVSSSKLLQSDEAQCRLELLLEENQSLADAIRDVTHRRLRLVLLNDPSARCIVQLEDTDRCDIVRKETEECVALHHKALLIMMMLRATRSLQSAGVIDRRFGTDHRLWSRVRTAVREVVNARRVSCVHNVPSLRRSNFLTIERVITVAQRWWRKRKHRTFGDVAKAVLWQMKLEKIRDVALGGYFRQLHGVSKTISNEQIAYNQSYPKSLTTRRISEGERDGRCTLEAIERVQRQNLVPFLVERLLRIFDKLRELSTVIEPGTRESIEKEWLAEHRVLAPAHYSIQLANFDEAEKRKRGYIAVQQQREWLKVDGQGAEMFALLETLSHHYPPNIPTIAQILDRPGNVRGARVGFLPPHNQRETMKRVLPVVMPSLTTQQKIEYREEMTRVRIETAAMLELRWWVSSDFMEIMEHVRDQLSSERLAELAAAAVKLDALFPGDPPLAQLRFTYVLENEGRVKLQRLEFDVRHEKMLLTHAGVVRLFWLQFMRSLSRFRSEMDYFYFHWAELLGKRLTRYGAKTDELALVEAGHRDCVAFFESLVVVSLME